LEKNILERLKSIGRTNSLTHFTLLIKKLFLSFILFYLFIFILYYAALLLTEFREIYDSREHKYKTITIFDIRTSTKCPAAAKFCKIFNNSTLTLEHVKKLKWNFLSGNIRCMLVNGGKFPIAKQILTLTTFAGR
jgi:hypothetical protein